MYYKGQKMERGPAKDMDFHGRGPSIRARLSELIPDGENLRVLDIGTGLASTVKFLLQHLSQKSRIWTVDPSKGVIASARAGLSTEDRRRVRFVRGVAHDLKFGAGSFDLVVSVMVMHHVADMPNSVAEMSRVLRGGGRLIVIDFAPEAHDLGFPSRHAKEDFFTSAAVSRAARAARLVARVEEHDKWYLVEARKPSLDDSATP